MMTLDQLFAQEEANRLAQARADIAREAADPEFQRRARERSEAFARELEAAEANPEPEDEDTDADDEDDEGEDA